MGFLYIFESILLTDEKYAIYFLCLYIYKSYSLEDVTHKYLPICIWDSVWDLTTLLVSLCYNVFVIHNFHH